jgi:pyruvate dehydrogenase E2 component (dihydrolipoamide acetyltransferase)
LIQKEGNEQTPRGLLVPVVRQANRLSLKQLSDDARQLATSALGGSITADEMRGDALKKGDL